MSPIWTGTLGEILYEDFAKVTFDRLLFPFIFRLSVKTILLILPKMILVEIDRKFSKNEQNKIYHPVQPAPPVQSAQIQSKVNIFRFTLITY